MSPTVSLIRFQEMPTDPTTAIPSTFVPSAVEPLDSAVSERPVVINCFPSTSEAGNPTGGFTVARNHAETAGEASRPKRRFPQVMPKTKMPTEDFALLEKWEGVVIAADAETFTARLYSASNRGQATQAVFSKCELSPLERGQIEEGAAFVWTIGYRLIGTTRHRDSVIYFRRLPRWEQEELIVSKTLGKKLHEAVGWNGTA